MPTIEVPISAPSARYIEPGTTTIVISEYRVAEARAYGCENFLELVQKVAENTWLDTERPDTFPHVDSRSFRFHENRLGGGGYSIAYNVRGGQSSAESGSAVEPTDQPGIWKLI